MFLAGLFAAVMFLALVVGDWAHFTSLTALASRYGCRVARMEDWLPQTPLALVMGRFERMGVFNLPHGIARCFYDERRILLRPQYRFFSVRFRTAWPMKVSIDVEQVGEDTRLMCIKRIPWSSAILTVMWFALVAAGTVGFALAFLAQGGLSTLGSILMGLGLTGLGLLVLAFGLVTFTLAYRLEDGRLTQAYQELRQALAGEPLSSHTPKHW